MMVNKCLLEKQLAYDKIIYVKFLVKSLLFCFLKKKDAHVGFCIIYVWELGGKKGEQIQQIKNHGVIFSVITWK